jgi:hypothetical protein
MVYVAFTYGVGIPMLFPIVCIASINMYICERL